jgi:predicted enzyme related to lactoylglutathione lyase
MASAHGKFIWYDVMTTDTKAAEAFYRDVVGWDAKDSGMPGHAYTIFSHGPAMVGGLMPIPEEARANGARPCWSGYIAVDDVDDYVTRVTAAGGKVHRPPEDIPGVGRFAVVADPYGAVFIMMTTVGDQQSPPVPPMTPGHVGWHELQAGDLDGAFAFYAGLFGWTKGEAIDMGPMGTYQLFNSDNGGGPACGGMMKKVPEAPMSFWLYYFTVDAIDAASARVTKGGGQVIHGPMEVPGGAWIVQCTDPQGAMFALVGMKR